MNPQYVNQQPPGGYNQGYGQPPASQPPQSFGGPPLLGQGPGQGPGPGQASHPAGVPQNAMFNGPSQRPPGPPAPGNFGAPPSKAGIPGPQVSQYTNGPPAAKPAGPPWPPGQQPGFRGTAPGQGFPPRPSTSQAVSGPPQGMAPQTQSLYGPPSLPPGPSQPPVGPHASSAAPPIGRPGPSQPPTNQMGAMSLGGSSSVGMPSGPPSSAAYGGPPTSMGPRPQAAPQHMPGQQPQSGHPPMPGQPSMAGPPPMPGQPSMAGPPPMPGQLPMPSQPPMATQPPLLGQPPMPAASGYSQQPPAPGMMPPPSSLSGSIPNSGPLPNVPFTGTQAGMPPPSPGGGFSGTQTAAYSGARPSMGPGIGTASQPQQPRRLDPDQMPSPIQVIEDDKLNRSGDYHTGQRGGVPPLVTTDFTVEDRGNCSPRFMRSTMYNIPCTSDMMKHSHLPFVLTISPFAVLKENESPLPLIELGQLGPVRCNRCKAYMNPYMQFVDGGRRFQCCFCGCNTDVPPEYFAHLDHTGKRVDCFDRPELCLGGYEFEATADYCKNNKLPNPPAYIFMIDVSYNAVKSGLVHLLCQHLKEDILLNLPKEAGMDESEVRVGFVTYDKELHFYGLKGSLAQPQMMVVSDVQDVFVPLLEGFLVKISESEGVIDSLLSQLPHTFAESRETEIVLGPVIQAGLDALKAAERVGKLLVFHTSLPVAEAPGKIKNRDDRKLLGTEKEKTILTPQNNFYTKLGQDCVAAGCGVDLFLFPNAYIDIATIGEVSRVTGGNIYKYSYFQADLDGKRLMDDLKNNIMRPIGFDCIMRIRTSTGIRPVDFLGNFYMSNTTDMEIANMDCDKSVAVEIKHDDKLSEAEGAVVQVALLYTSITGQRRLRILNMGLNCCTQMSDLFRNCELDSFVNYMAKSAIRECLNSNPKVVRENLTNKCSQILACYRKNCASPSSAGQLILPECMKLLPLYTNCIIKSHMLQGASEVSTDDRSYLMHVVNSMSVNHSYVFFHPRLLPLHEMDMESENATLPTPIRCSYERLKDNGVYLIENGLSMLLWIGMNVPQEMVSSLFGVHSAAQIDIDQTRLQDLDNPASRTLRSVVQNVREERLRYLKLVIVRQRDKLEPVFQQYLVEDRGTSGSASYVDFLCHIHKEIRQLLS